MKSQKQSHPYHYYVDKGFAHRVLDLGLPTALFLIYFIFYNFGKFTPHEMVKTTGLLAISLLAITLLIGPLCRIIPSLDFLKAHRKFWGISSFVAALIHTGLVYIYYFKFNLFKFIDTTNPKYAGILSGLLALVILFLVTVTSNQKIVNKLSPKTWKIIQTTSYLALILAVSHFYLMETVNGVLVIKKLLGRITLWFSVFVILARVIILVLPSKK